jgi:hypothetical protein
MNDNYAAAAVTVRMGVFFGGAAMGGPTGVADAEGALEGMLAEHLLQIAEFAWGAGDLKGGTRGAADGDAGRVVATVFEAPQAFDDDRDYLLGSYISNNAAHGTILSDGEENWG